MICEACLGTGVIGHAGRLSACQLCRTDDADSLEGAGYDPAQSVVDQAVEDIKFETLDRMLVLAEKEKMASDSQARGSV